MPRKNATIKGKLLFKKVSQGVARFEAQINESKGNLTIALDSDVLGKYDPLIHDVIGTIELNIKTKKK